MPASSGDPISAAITHMSSSSKLSSDAENLESQIIGSAKRILLNGIKYEHTDSYKTNVTDYKNNYVLLKTANSNLDNGGIKLTNGLTKTDNAAASSSKTLTPPSPTTSNMCNNTKSASSGNNGPKSDAVLPSPKKVLFPPEKIQLGWQSKSVPIGSGMVNLGNTCYLNSTLQALFHVPSFVNWLLNDKVHKDKCETLNGVSQMECLICAMLKTLKNSMDNSAMSNPIRPNLIYTKLKLICKRLIHGHQEDAHEFLRYLIESMDRSYLRIMQATNLDNYSKETTPLSQIFGGYLRTEVRCLECRHISLTFQYFQDLLLDIRQSSSIEEALEAYFSLERLGDGDEAYKCDKCHRRVAATKQFAVEKPPNVLCIQLKRFGIMGGKNGKHVKVQQSLDLTRFWVHRTGQPGSRFNYKLVSLVSHIGSSSNCGHYTAIGLTCSGQFYLFDDSMVRPVMCQSVSDFNTYIVMYELCSPNPTLNSSKPVAASTCTVTRDSQPSSNASSSSASSTSKAMFPSFTVNGNRSSTKPASHSTPGKSMTTNTIANNACTKSGQSLVPYLAESSDSETEPSSAKQTVSLTLLPVKNGFAKGSAESSNCAVTSTLSVSCKSSVDDNVVVNGWHVTTVPQRSPTDGLHSPLQNWDVVETPHCKNGVNGEDSSQSKAPVQNGVNGKESRTKPAENGYENVNHTVNNQRKYMNGSSDHGPLTNGKHWDGNRNNSTLEVLRKNNHQGYGSNVTTWSGDRTQVDREVDNDRLQQRKRDYDQMYEDEYDQGKVKKMKSNNHHMKNGDRQPKGRRNFFQEQQNQKNNNNWYGRNHFYRNYGNNFRTYQNNRNQSYHWRR